LLTLFAETVLSLMVSVPYNPHLWSTWAGIGSLIPVWTGISNPGKVYRLKWTGQHGQVQINIDKRPVQVNMDRYRSIGAGTGR
jgi:hypothetical protein